VSFAPLREILIFYECINVDEFERSGQEKPRGVLGMGGRFAKEDPWVFLADWIEGHVLSEFLGQVTGHSKAGNISIAEGLRD